MKQEKGAISLLAIIGIIIAIIVIAFIAWLVIGVTLYENLKDESNTETTNIINNENKVISNNITSTTTNDNHDNDVVVGGFKITIPEENNYLINNQGLIIYDENLNWQMLLLVRDNSYSSAMQNPENLMSGAINSGGNIKETIKEIEISRKKYAYFTYEKGNNHYIVAYTAAGKEKRFGIQVEANEELNSSILNIFNEIVSTAIETNEPDTTQEDIDKAHRVLPGTAKEYGELTVNNTTVKYSVPSEFYSTGVNSYTESESSEGFTTENSRVNVLYNLTSNFYFDGIDEYLKSSTTMSENVRNVKISEIQTINISGKDIKYITIQYEKDYSGETTTFKKLYAAYKLSNDYVLQFNADTLYNEEELNIDRVKGFFNITE